MSTPRHRSKAFSFLMFCLVSGLAGLLMAGLAVPTAALAGVSATAVSDSFNDLPIELLTPPTFKPTTVYMADGTQLAQFYAEYRKEVTLDQVAPIMRTAQIAIEDDRFYDHGAIDPKGILRALAVNASGDSQQGASTLTQQYVKQVLMETALADGDMQAWQDAQALTYSRKLREMRYAIGLERKYTKDEILEKYLNIAYYGDGAYGIEAAAEHYYNTTAAELTLAQAAMLAGIVQNPTRDPYNMTDEAITRRNIVINRMLELDYITKDQATAAKAEGFDRDVVKPINNGCFAPDVRYQDLCYYVQNLLYQNPALGATEKERVNNVNRAGYEVHTLINPESQDAAQQALDSFISATDPVIATITIVQPGTGLIVAMAQNRNKLGNDPREGVTYWNYSTGGDGYQPGSTMKPAVTAAALAKGIPIVKTFNAVGTMDMTGKVFPTCGDPITVTKDEKWKVSNSVRGHDGVMDMAEGTAFSVNTYYVQLEQAVGLCDSVKTADALGVRLADPHLYAAQVSQAYMAANNIDYVTKDGTHLKAGKDVDPTGNLATQDRLISQAEAAGMEPITDADAFVRALSTVPSFVLGVAQVTPLSMAAMYATFAARGVYCTPIMIQDIKDRDGNDVNTPSANCQQVIPAEVADGVSSLLQGVVNGGTGKNAALDDGRPVAGKTGTTQYTQAVSFAGYTPQLAAVAEITWDKDPAFATVWADRKCDLPEQKGHPCYIDNFKLEASGTYIDGSGGADAAKLWKAAMTAALAGTDPADPANQFVAPTDEIVNGKKVAMPDITGQSPEQAKATLEAAGFQVGSQQVYDDRVPSGTYLGATCDGYYGGQCYLNYSGGPRPLQVIPQQQGFPQGPGSAQDPNVPIQLPDSVWPFDQPTGEPQPSTGG